MNSQTLDMSLFRSEDVPLVTAVDMFLKSHRLEYELGGSALKGAREGIQPGGYNDIDLLVRAQASSTARYNAILDLARLALGVRLLASAGARTLGKDIAVEHIGQGKIRYFGTIVENRFKLRQGKSIVDLCFESLIKGSYS